MSKSVAIAPCLRDPAAADRNVPIVENRGLAWRDGALRLVEGGEDFVFADSLNRGPSGLVAMANLHAHAHRLAQIVHGDQVHAPGARIEMLFPADNHLLVRAADLDDVERRTRGDAKSLALAHSEVVNAAVLADDFSIRSDQIAGGVRQCLALLGKVGIDKALVVAAGDKANFLRVGLFGERQAVLASEFANFGLGHVAERENRAAELLLGQAEKKISLILALVGGTLEQPAVACFVKGHAGVVSGGDALSPNLLCHNE